MYDCSICNKTFPSRNGLKAHTSRLHSEEKCSFECARCDKKYRSASSLSVHFRSHKKNDVLLVEKYSKSMGTEKESEIEKKLDSLMNTTKELIHDTNREMFTKLTKKIESMTATSILPTKVDIEPVNELGSIYLLQEREFMTTSQNIYKVGMTSKPHLSRFVKYPKGSKIIYIITCENHELAEKIVLRKFKEEFTQMTLIGREYFKGSHEEMFFIMSDVKRLMTTKAVTTQGTEKI